MTTTQNTTVKRLARSGDHVRSLATGNVYYVDQVHYYGRRRDFLEVRSTTSNLSNTLKDDQVEVLSRAFVIQAL